MSEEVGMVRSNYRAWKIGIEMEEHVAEYSASHGHIEHRQRRKNAFQEKLGKYIYFGQCRY